jgi:hypothetical protein
MLFKVASMKKDKHLFAGALVDSRPIRFCNWVSDNFALFGFLLVLLLVPSLRKYRRKRNLVIYAVAGIILSSLLLQAYEASLRSPLFTV